MADLKIKAKISGAITKQFAHLRLRIKDGGLICHSDLSGIQSYQCLDLTQADAQPSGNDSFNNN